MLEKHAEQIDERLRSKALYAVRTLESGSTPRAHILDGRVFGGLLTEIFDKVGVGTMIHANDYQQIRPARKKDAQAIYNITRAAIKTEKLRQRTREQIERDIDNYYVYEIDGSVIGCACLLPLEGTDAAELASLFVTPFYQGRGVGHKLAEFACLEAQRRGHARVLALSTQSYSFFRDVCGFEDGTVEDLPAAKQEDYAKNGRNSRILVKRLRRRRRDSKESARFLIVHATSRIAHAFSTNSAMMPSKEPLVKKTTRLGWFSGSRAISSAAASNS